MQRREDAPPPGVVVQSQTAADFLCDTAETEVGTHFSHHTLFGFDSSFSLLFLCFCFFSLCIFHIYLEPFILSCLFLLLFCFHHCLLSV